MIDIKKMRELKGWTQKELAERCNVTLRTVQNWEQGKHIPESTLTLLELLGYPMKESEAAPAGPANSPGGEYIQPDRFLAALERQQSLLLEQMKSNTKRDEQIDRLLSLLENDRQSKQS